MENYCKLILIISLSLSPLAVGADLDQCLKISNDRDRLKCYDKLHGFDQSSEANIGRLENRTLERPSPVKLGSSQTEGNKDADGATISAAQKAYDTIIANSQTLKISNISKSRSGKVYYYTQSGRVFRKNTDRTVTFKRNDSVTLELGFLGSMFMTNQDNIRIKVKEMKVRK
ncbi:hypothetical protein N9W36_04205 [Porticoccaceae bacterium]|nr:hypothetical protein [Porticoccaceae bacterium]